VDGNAAIWGTVPDASTPALNQNKKITIIVTGNVQVIGDILPSDSPYLSGTQNSDEIDPNPLVDNPNQDAVAILTGGNVYVNPYYRVSPAYFINDSTNCCGGDMRVWGFLYAPNGVTGGAHGDPGAWSARGYQRYINSYRRNIQQFTFHGAIVVDTSGFLPSGCYATTGCGGSCSGCNYGYNRFYDPNLKYNLSKVIPSGTSLTSWQEMTDVPLIPVPTPTATPLI